MLSLIVLIPLASVMVSALKLRPAEFWSLITKPTVRHAFATSIGCSFIAALINSVFGVIIAWVLVRYEFPGKRILDGCIELPFALPTSVAGITLSKMYSENGILGTPLAKHGIKVSYTHLGLVIALVFVGIPFVIRAVQNYKACVSIVMVTNDMHQFAPGFRVHVRRVHRRIELVSIDMECEILQLRYVLFQLLEIEIL